MIKKIAAYVLFALMILGVVISAANFFGTNLHTDERKKVTYHPEIPDCFGPAKDCYDLTSPPTT
jgi:hypothetical protein